MRPFEGIRVIDATHVLAGPFAAYQLGVLGADVIKIEDPNDPDQSRGSGTDKALNHKLMGTAFLTQGSNKRSVALDLKQERDRERRRREDHVAVEPQHPRARRRVDAGVALGRALGTCGDHPVGEPTGHVRGAVGAVVVDHDELHVGVRLLDDRAQAGLDGADVVARRDDDGDGCRRVLLGAIAHGSSSSGGSGRR